MFEIFSKIRILPEAKYPPGLTGGYLYAYAPGNCKDEAIDLLQKALASDHLKLDAVEEISLLDLNDLPKDLAFTRDELFIAQEKGYCLRSTIWGWHDK